MQENQQENMATEETAIKKRWDDYLKNLQNKPPRGIVKRFLQHLNPNDEFISKTHVVDIGCGPGNDSNFYAGLGFKVTAVDNNAFAIKKIQENKHTNKNITAAVCDITTTSIPKCDIASASYLLPFISPSLFDTTWNKNIVPSITPNGYFVGHFLGNEDGWANTYKESMTFLTEDQVKKLFDSKTSEFEKANFKEKKKMATMANGGSKYWHIFTVFARKKSISTKENIDHLPSNDDTQLLSSNKGNSL